MKSSIISPVGLDNADEGQKARRARWAAGSGENVCASIHEGFEAPGSLLLFREKERKRGEGG